FRAFQDGSAVSKDCHFIKSDAEANQEIVLPNIVHHWLQTKNKFGKVEGPAALVNLYRIAAAKRNMQLSFPFQIPIMMLHTSPAFRIAGHANRLQAASPNVAGNQPPM